METRQDTRQSLEARIEVLERRMDEMAEKASHNAEHTETRMRSQLDSLRTRLAAVRTHLREKQEADDRAEDAALAELGHELNALYAELLSEPK